MSQIKSVIEKNAVATYFLLTFLLSWGCMSLMIKPYSFPLTPEQSEAVGPLLYVGMLVGPSVSSLLLIGLLEGKAGYRELFSRLTRWRVSSRWYAAAILGTPFLATFVLMTLSMVSPVFMPTLFTTGDKSGLLGMGIGVGLMVAFFEEIGWTGFVVPRLLKKTGINTTGLIIGIAWGAWHFPPFWGVNSFSGGLSTSILFCQLFAWLSPFRILMVHVYEKTQSLLVTTLVHVSLVFTTLTLPSIELSGFYLLVWLISWGINLWSITIAIKKKGYNSKNRGR